MGNKVDILLVDDREENLTALEAVLAAPEYNLVKASSGQEALKLAFDRDFALILLDVQMPEMDGFEAATYLRYRERSRQTPIIFITAISTEERFVYRGYEAGAVDYIFKPFEPSILKAKVAIFVDLYKKTQLIKKQNEVMREHERRDRERQIVQLELENFRRYRNLADAIPHVVWKAQENGLVDYINRVWLEYSGLSFEQSIGRGWLSSIDPEDVKILQEKWDEAEKTQQGFEVECRVLRASDSAYRWHLIRAIPETDFVGRVTAWLGTGTDIHERKEAQKQLEQAKKIAEAANAAKSTFLANVSHEIRTPLGAILGFADMMVDPQQNIDERKNCVNTIRRNGKQLLRIIDEVLDLSKIEAGRLEIEKMPFDLKALVDEVCALLHVQAREKDLRLKITWRRPSPKTIISDPTRLRQILTNILGNSIKFTSKGSVEIVVSLPDWEEGQQGRSSVLFAIRDTGCGINEEQQGQLFQPFAQADTSITRKFGGTGLGLTLSRKLARSLGGDVVLFESHLDQGSTFLVEIAADIPLQIQEADEESSRKSEKLPRLDGMRILLAEDGPDNQVLLRRILEMSGAQVDAVEDGRSAVNKALDSDFDVVLMDIQMPVMNGYYATQQLRKASYSGPILALTAYAMKEERERCINAGCDDYLTKPVSPETLIRKVASLAAEHDEQRQSHS